MNIISKIMSRIKFYRSIRFFKYLYLNYFCKSIIRKGQCRVIPYKNAVVDITKSARWYVSDGDVEIGHNLLNGSKTETRVRLRDHSVWKSNGGCRLCYNTTIDLQKNAYLETGNLFINSGSVIVVAEKMTIGTDSMIGRNNILYDSDFHSIFDANGKIINASKPVVVGKHVWITTNNLVLKGTTIGDNVIVGSHSIVNGNIPANVIYRNNRSKPYSGKWDRQLPIL